MLSIIYELKGTHGISIFEGENFKQAVFNGKLTDLPDQLRDKIELAIKHYPGRDLIIGTYESDETSPAPFAYAVVLPIHE